ncbi:MAG: hypothetical protein KHW63_01380 [Alistipes sp.]|nr:hypothetical protein [Alistipes sp.]
MTEALLHYADAARETARRFAELGALLDILRTGGPRTKKGKRTTIKTTNFMAKRAKKIILSGVTREAMEEAFGCYATADAEMQRINAEIKPGGMRCSEGRDAEKM